MKACLLALAVLVSSVGAQTPAPAQGRAIGVVTAIAAETRAVTLRADDGQTQTINVAESAAIWRVPPGEKDLSHASKIEFSEIAAGDRVLARGNSVIVIKQDDLAKKQQAERQQWLREGVVGTITQIDRDKREVTISGRGKQLTRVQVKDAAFRRYSPGSVKFADAQPGKFEDLAEGDQMRALGKRTDESGYVAAQVVTGAFQTIAATINSVDAANLNITDLSTKKRLSLRTSTDSTLRRLPPPLAARLSNRNQEGGGPDLQQMIERLPPLDVKELKSGDAIIFSTVRSQDPAGMTAIVLLAGVEPLLTAPSSRGRQQQAIGEWSLGMDMALP